MKLILTYTGDLKSKQKDPVQGKSDKLADHITSIRRVFHDQLREHWINDPFLSNKSSYPRDYGLDIDDFPPEKRTSPERQNQVLWTDLIPELHRVGAYRFLPLVREGWHLQCELDILFLRTNPPGSLVQAGDIDNRIKTLFDALRMPQRTEELGASTSPSEEETPFFTLLEDDQLIRRLNVDTGRLLETRDSNNSKSWVKLVITAKLRPTRATMLNLSFV